MKATPLFLGACVFASIAGAVGGATTNTTPIQNAGIGMNMLPERAFAFDPSDDGRPEMALPDHYPMVTPSGRIEVAELSTRGLYSQQRFGWRSAGYEPLPEQAFAEEPGRVIWDEPESPPPSIEARPIAPPIAPLEVPPPPAG